MTPIGTTWHPVDGLGASAEILVDRWGVPHIYASSTYDAFFAQGFNAARERLWQIDLWRCRGLGFLSEVFGASFVEQDRAARLFLYRGGMHREWLAYSSDTKRVATAFVRGINEYVRLTRENPDRLPEEFRIVGRQLSRGCLRSDHAPTGDRTRAPHAHARAPDRLLRGS